MHTRIQKLGLANGIKATGKSYKLSEIVHESYKISYEAKKINNKMLINLTESHLANIKEDPSKRTLSEDLDVLKGLVKLGKDQKLKDIEEVKAPKKRRKRSIDSCVKPATKVKESWSSSKDAITKSLESFRESAKAKVFYKELDKFNKGIAKKAPITMTEAIKLYKASNSCLTHLTVELEKNPSFRESYKECTKLLSRDTAKLLESIQEGKIPSRPLLESFVSFTNILLESNTPEELDPELYEDADLEELEGRDVINEDADLEELDDRDVINEDADLEELDDRDVLDEDADLEELDDRDVLNEGEEEDCEDGECEELPEDADLEELDDRDVLNEEEEEFGSEGNDSVSVDLTPEEISLLRSILTKISAMEESEDVDTVPDEEEIPEPAGIEEEIPDEESPDEEIVEEDEEEEIPDEDVIDSEEDFVDEDPIDVEDDFVDEEDEDLEEDDVDEEDPIASLEAARNSIDNAIATLAEDDLEEETEEEEPAEDFDFQLSESAIKRIKKCF